MPNLADLTKDELITYIQYLLDALNNFDGIVGDVPVSEQLSVALAQMADKTHTHEDYALRKELNALKLEIEKLTDLVGDVAVSEQINAALNGTK
jgi:hypothetical protein